MEENENSSDILNTKTGDNERPKGTISPAKVTIASVVVKTKDKEGKTMTTPLVQFMVKHPEKDDLIVISKVQLIENKKIINKGFWVEKDKENNFYKGSAISTILEALECKTLSETYGKEIDTIEESEESPYLCLKAY